MYRQFGLGAGIIQKNRSAKSERQIWRFGSSIARGKQNKGREIGRGNAHLATESFHMPNTPVLRKQSIKTPNAETVEAAGSSLRTRVVESVRPIGERSTRNVILVARAGSILLRCGRSADFLHWARSITLVSLEKHDRKSPAVAGSRDSCA